MVDPAIIETVKTYLQKLNQMNLHAHFAVIFGSQINGSENPLSDDYLKDKSVDCTRSIQTETNRSALMENINGLDELGDVHRLIERASAADEKSAGRQFTERSREFCLYVAGSPGPDVPGLPLAVDIAWR